MHERCPFRQQHTKWSLLLYSKRITSSGISEAAMGIMYWNFINPLKKLSNSTAGKLPIFSLPKCFQSVYSRACGMSDNLQFYYWQISVEFLRGDDMLILYYIKLRSEKRIIFLKQQSVGLLWLSVWGSMCYCFYCWKFLDFIMTPRPSSWLWYCQTWLYAIIHCSHNK